MRRNQDAIDDEANHSKRVAAARAKRKAARAHMTPKEAETDILQEAKEDKVRQLANSKAKEKRDFAMAAGNAMEAEEDKLLNSAKSAREAARSNMTANQAEMERFKEMQEEESRLDSREQAKEAHNAAMVSAMHVDACDTRALASMNTEREVARSQMTPEQAAADRLLEAKEEDANLVAVAKSKQNGKAQDDAAFAAVEAEQDKQWADNHAARKAARADMTPKEAEADILQEAKADKVRQLANGEEVAEPVSPPHSDRSNGAAPTPHQPPISSPELDYAYKLNAVPVLPAHSPAAEEEEEPPIWGPLTWDGGKYEGQFKNEHLKGTVTDPSDLHKRHGSGKYTHFDGAVYEGQFVDDEKHGHGRMTFPKHKHPGHTYDGQWQNGKCCGQGVVTYADGAAHVGVWHWVGAAPDDQPVWEWVTPCGPVAVSHAPEVPSYMRATNASHQRERPTVISTRSCDR